MQRVLVKFDTSSMMANEDKKSYQVNKNISYYHIN